MIALFASHSKFSNHFLRTTLSVVALLFAGCDLTGEYSTRIQEAAANQAKVGAFIQHLNPAPTPLAIGAAPLCSLQLPLFIDGESQTLQVGANDKAGKAVVATRAMPPFGAIPGFTFSYERPVDNGAGQKLPVYFYVGGVPLADMKPEAVMDQLAKDIKTGMPQANPAWKDTSVPTPAGAAIAYKLLSVTGEQTFDGSAAGVADAKAAGRCDLYVATTPTHILILGWRAPAGSDAKVNFWEAAKAAMGTVVLPVAAPPGGAAAAPGVVPGVAPAGS